MNVKVSIILSLLLLRMSVHAEEVTLPQIIENNTRAVGGREAIEAIKSVEISLRIEEPEFVVDAVYVAQREPRMRIDIYSDGKRVYTEGYDGKAGWQMGESGPATDSTPLGSAALLHGIQMPGKMFGLHEMEANSHKLEYVGRESAESINYHVLKLTLKDGHVMHYFIHPETWLIERSRDIRALHPDVDPATKVLETRFSDFRKVGKVVRAYASEQVDLRTGKQLQKTTMKEIKMNPVIDTSIFAKPK